MVRGKSHMMKVAHPIITMRKVILRMIPLLDLLVRLRILTTTVTMNKVIFIRIGKKHTMMTEPRITITLLEKQLMNILGENSFYAKHDH